jgi:predicted RNase H-like HicB family nuclease
MKREYTVVIEMDEDGYFVGTVPELKGCHTQAKSLDILMRRIKEAVLLCLEVVPVHKGESIGRGLILKILRDTELSREDFVKLL